MTKLRFKPAYNPYTEPSMEVFSYHEGGERTSALKTQQVQLLSLVNRTHEIFFYFLGLKKWIEVGNSGIFRPEMLLPMGLPEDVSVIAWGLSLER